MIGLRLLAVMILVGVNGFFVAAEFSLVAVRLSRVRQLVERGDARARVVQELLGQLDRVLSGVQVGITLASLGLGALGEPTLARMFLPLVDWLPGSTAATIAHSAAVALSLLILTILHVVLGELVPKTISVEHAGSTSLLIARPLYWYLHAFRWAIDLLDGLSQRVVRLVGVVASQAASHTIAHSPEELQIQIRQAREHGLLAASQAHSMLGALELGQLRVREIMVPRPDVYALSDKAGLDETLALFATTQRSRLPVFEGTLDHVLGFLHIKDVLWVVLDRQRRTAEGAAVQPFDSRRLLRELLIVPESKLASELLTEMRARRHSLAMVVDEFGSILGLVTLEDLLEQVVGDIHDEFDVIEGPLIVGTGTDAVMVFDGGIGLHELEMRYNVALAEDPAYSTLGGFVLAQLGFIPRGGEGFAYGGYRFTVVEMDRRRVARVKVQRLTPLAAAPLPPVSPENEGSTATPVHLSETEPE